MNAEPTSTSRRNLILKLLDYFLSEGFTVHGARDVDGYKLPPLMKNDSFGKLLPHRPDVIAMDPKRRIVFGIVRETRSELDCEDSLEEYNLYLDHNAALGEQASVVYVMMPQQLVGEFTDIITHYIHREYWARITPVAA